MVIILRIFSAFAYLSVGSVVVLGVLGLMRENSQVEQILQQPSIVERFEESCDKQDKAADEDVYMGIAGKMGSYTGSHHGFVLVKHASNFFRMWVVNDGTFIGISSDVTYTDTDWHHVAGVVKNGTGYLYVDGIEQAETTRAEFNDSGAYAFIGRQYDDDYDNRRRFWNGTIDDVRIYYRALSEQEILGL